MALRALLVLAAGLACAGCTETVYLQDRQTGQTARCGGHPYGFPIYDVFFPDHGQDCINYYRNQGYLVVPRPA